MCQAGLVGCTTSQGPLVLHTTAARPAFCIAAAHEKNLPMVFPGFAFTFAVVTFREDARIGALRANTQARATFLTSAPPLCKCACWISDRKPAAQHLVAAGRAREATRYRFNNRSVDMLPKRFCHLQRRTASKTAVACFRPSGDPVKERNFNVNRLSKQQRQAEHSAAEVSPNKASSSKVNAVRRNGHDVHAMWTSDQMPAARVRINENTHDMTTDVNNNTPAGVCGGEARAARPTGVAYLQFVRLAAPQSHRLSVGHIQTKLSCDK